jgi:hypothetical protein
MVFSILFLILAAGFSYLSFAYKSGENDYDTMKSKKFLEVIIAGVEFVVALLIAWFLYSCIGTISEFNTVVLEISKARCSDSFSNRIFTSYGESLVRLQI